jgi:hypothetical protein
VACAVPDEDDPEPAEPEEVPDEPEERAAEPEDDAERLPPGLLSRDDPLAVPEEAREPEPPTVAVVACAEPGSVAATAPAARTLATPTPAVTADSRFMPRRLSAGGGTVWPPGLLGIGTFLPSRWVGRARAARGAGRVGHR